MSSKIGLYIPTLGGGGAQRVALNLAQGFLSKGCEINLVLVKREGRLKDEVPVGVNVVDLGARRTLTSIPKLASHLRYEWYDAILSFMGYANVCAVTASLLSRGTHKLILTEHNTLSRSLEEMDNLNGWVHKKLIQYLYPFADHITAVSKGAASDLEYVADLQNVTAVLNPISVNSTQDINSKKSVHPWFADPNPVVLGAGSLTEQKGFDTLIRAIRYIHDQGRTCRLTIIGEGEKRKDLEALIRDLDLGGVVSLPGFADNPYEYMRAADVFALSSRWEGFGNVLVEAMACGTPVVSTDCPNGPAEILEDGKWGHLVSVGDDEALAQAIIDTLNEPPVSSDELVERVDDFSPEKIADQYLSVLKNGAG